MVAPSLRCPGTDQVFGSWGAMVVGRRGSALVACDVTANTTIELAADAAPPDLVLADPEGKLLSRVHRSAHDAEILLWMRSTGVRALEVAARSRSPYRRWP